MYQYTQLNLNEQQGLSTSLLLGALSGFPISAPGSLPQLTGPKSSAKTARNLTENWVTQGAATPGRQAEQWVSTSSVPRALGKPVVEEVGASSSPSRAQDGQTRSSPAAKVALE